MTWARVTSDGRGHGEVTIDGTNISSAVRAVNVLLTAGSSPRLEIELSVLDVTCDISDGVDLLIPSDTREALVRLGWTPPPDPA